MKVAIFLLTFSQATPRENFDRYQSLLEMVQYYTPGFDERQYFQYGCHCVIREDQLDKNGMGKPVDQLDSVCRKYKNCQKVLQSRATNCYTINPYDLGYFFEKFSKIVK